MKKLWLIGTALAALIIIFCLIGSSVPATLSVWAVISSDVMRPFSSFVISADINMDELQQYFTFVKSRYTDAPVPVRRSSR